MSKKYLRDLVPLIVICLISALLLASFNLFTKGPIAENTLRTAQETRSRLLAAATDFESMELPEGSGMDSCYQGVDASGEPVGYVIQTTVNGYGGEVVVTLGMDMDGVITGVDVGGENFSETAGLGALAKEPAFTSQYIGKKVPLKLIKGNETKGEDTIDSISGATRTSSAVNGGINLAGKYIADLSGTSSPNTASAQGFGGPVAVTLELDGDGAISSIVIGDDYFNETEGYGKKALEESFSAQFIGKKPPLSLDDIDAISGATVTSTAVVNAINTVYGQLTGEAAPAPAEEDAPKALFYEDGAWRASSKGFGGPVAVKLVLNGATIEEIEIGDADFNETEGFGAKAKEPAFQEQFVGKTLPVTASDIDAISGATITTTAVLDAIDQIYQAATDDVADEPQPVPAEAAAVPASAEPAGAAAALGEDGVWTASSQGFAGPVAVKLTLDGATITAMEVGDDSFAETPGLGANAKEPAFISQFIGKTLPVTAADIDAISGATITTTAVLDAIDAIYQAAGAEAPVAEPAVEPTAAPDLEPTTQPNSTDGVSGEESTWFASYKGFAGPVSVRLTLDGMTIKAMEVGGASFAETPGLGGKAQEPEFTAQFIGKTLPLTADDIDAISGATITTNAVLGAVELIYQAAGSKAALAEPTVEPTAVPTAEPSAAPSGEETSWFASYKGFAGPVSVRLTLDGMTIKAIAVGGASFAETPGLGGKAQEPEFTSQFVGKTLPLTAGDIDGIAGATITTTAVLNAIDMIYQAAK
ncbi:MAG: FMN-binding protein [Clostridiales bacterium]|nr:FMN-binding protein [Clostridiales bacterium]MDO4350288.1 FMN-binding protein [Eubacteriales bacterium]MDY4008398.1 FMN-binding protein [Candidatus Limiplasma sp.]